MSQPTIPLNLQVANPTLSTVLNNLKTEIFLTLNCHALATVQSFTQNANGLFVITARMNYNKTYYELQTNGSYAVRTVEYPLLVDCPAITLGGGSTALTFPIVVGDQCLIFFNDRDINNWFAGANSGPVATARMHSFADGIALVGFQKVAAYDSAHALLSNGNAQVGIPATTSGAAAAKVRIANSDTSLYVLLNSLITTIQDLAIVVAGTSGTVSPTSVAELNSVNTSLQGLLE